MFLHQFDEEAVEQEWRVLRGWKTRRAWAAEEKEMWAMFLFLDFHGPGLEFSSDVCFRVYLIEAAEANEDELGHPKKHPAAARENKSQPSGPRHA